MWALLALACAKGRPRCPGWKAAHKAMCSLSKDSASFSFVDKKLLSPSCSEGQARWQRGVCDGLKHDHKFLVLPLRWRLGIPASSLIDSGWAVAALLPSGVWKKRHSCDCGVWVMKRHLIKSGTLMLGGLGRSHVEASFGTPQKSSAFQAPTARRWTWLWTLWAYIPTSQMRMCDLCQPK